VVVMGLGTGGRRGKRHNRRQGQTNKQGSNHCATPNKRGTKIGLVCATVQPDSFYRLWKHNACQKRETAVRLICWPRIACSARSVARHFR
jgi:hypothetical protein